MTKILVADDDILFCDMLCAALTSLPVETCGCYNTNDAWQKLDTQKPQLLILDVMMPQNGGLALLKRIRQRDDLKWLYVIMLTAKTAHADIMNGLDSGADDYVAKPFELPELIARVRKGLRWVEAVGAASESQPESGSLILCKKSFEAIVGKIRLHLTASEFYILGLFITHPNQAFSREYIISKALNGNDPGLRTIDTHVNNLRRKLTVDPRLASSIKSVHRVGYKFAPPDNYKISVE